jgi:hypothetical protein
MSTQTTLLERNAAGFEVEINYLPLAGLIVLQTRRNGEQAAVTIAPDRVFDAFEHPAIYLNAAQVEQLFARAAE